MINRSGSCWCAGGYRRVPRTSRRHRRRRHHH